MLAPTIGQTNQDAFKIRVALQSEHTIKIVKLSKRELYFVKNYEMFSTKVSAREKQGQNSGGPHHGVIGSLRILSAGRPF